MWFLVLLLLALWVFIGNPNKDVADWLWPNSAAPWEKVDAFYYPNRDNLFKSLSQINLRTLEECRSWVQRTANYHNDSRLERGDYECGVGYLYNLGEVKVYRLTVR